MKPSLHNTDMDFRVIPSVIPLQSPSPDKKNANNITPTVSPSPIQIKKNITPIRRNMMEKENSKCHYQRSTDMKYATHSPGMDYSSALKEKEDIINNLKRIIDLITENGRKKTYEEGEESDLKKQVKILTIQNQKLVNIVEKMRNKQHRPEETIKVQERYEKEIGELMETMKISKQEHQDEQRQLKRLYKALNIHCKNIQGQKKELELENQKLLKILKDKNQTEKKINQKSRISEGSEAQSEKSQKNQRITLLKIKEQYGENMKMLREGLVKEIEETFDTMRIALQGVGSKVTHLTVRLESIERLIWQRTRKINKLEEEDDSPLGKNRKSEIYIEEGPDSSHPSHQTSKEEGVEMSRSSSNELRQQLSKAKAELEELRFKYDKLCLDTSTVSYSKRISLQKGDLADEYDKMLLELSKKDRQIQILYSQIKTIEQDNLEASRQRYQQWESMMENKENAIIQLKERHFIEIEEIKAETQLKVKLLVENYDKEIELLKKQIVLKNTDLHQATQVHQINRTDSEKKIEDLHRVISQLKDRIQELNSQLQLSEGKLKQQKLEAEINQQGWNNEKKNLQSKCFDLQNICKTDRGKREEIEQEVILQMVEIGQHRRQAQLANKKCLQLEEEFKDRVEELEGLLNAEKAERQRIEGVNQSKDKIMDQMKGLLRQCRRDSILGQIDELQKLASSQLQKSKNLEKEYTTLSIANQKQQVRKLHEQLTDLRESLQEKEEKCIQQEAKIIELQGLCELNRTKFEEQQALHLELLSKHKELETSSHSLQLSLKETSCEEVLHKINELRELQEARMQQIDSVLLK